MQIMVIKNILNKVKIEKQPSGWTIFRVSLWRKYSWYSPSNTTEQLNGNWSLTLSAYSHFLTPAADF